MRLIKLFFNNSNLLVEAPNALNSYKCTTSESRKVATLENISIKSKTITFNYSVNCKRISIFFAHIFGLNMTYKQQEAYHANNENNFLSCQNLNI